MVELMLTLTSDRCHLPPQQLGRDPSPRVNDAFHVVDERTNERSTREGGVETRTNQSIGEATVLDLYDGTVVYTEHGMGLAFRQGD
jgi:hypothetical protein